MMMTRLQLVNIKVTVSDTHSLRESISILGESEDCSDDWTVSSKHSESHLQSHTS